MNAWVWMLTTEIKPHPLQHVAKKLKPSNRDIGEPVKDWYIQFEANVLVAGRQDILDAVIAYEVRRRLEK